MGHLKCSQSHLAARGSERRFESRAQPRVGCKLHPMIKKEGKILTQNMRWGCFRRVCMRQRRVAGAETSPRAGPAPHLCPPCPRVQKCADLNQMSTKNLSLLFAPSLFQTDGKGEHEVKVMEDLIDNYVSIFNVRSLQGPCQHSSLCLCPSPIVSPHAVDLHLPLHPSILAMCPQATSHSTLTLCTLPPAD